MKKIPLLFEQVWDKEGNYLGITDKANPKIADIFTLCNNASMSIKPTIKYDGSACAVIDGIFYRRYDAKKGKKPPVGAIPCQDAPDLITGHFPHWVIVDPQDPADKYFYKGFLYYADIAGYATDGTYELIGEKVQGNPYNLNYHTLVKHGTEIVYLDDFSYNTIKEFLDKHYVEGLVFWLFDSDNKPVEPVAKIRRKDFELEWNE